MKELERDIQQAIIDYLRLKRIFCFKVSTVGIYKKETGSYIPSQNVGCPDIFVVIAGKLIGIEVKTKKGIQSDAQKNWQKKLEEAGGTYLIARSVDDIMKLL